MNEEHARTNFEQSGASQYIEELIEGRLAYLTPSSLRGKEVGYRFRLDTGELVGYEAMTGDKYSSIDLDTAVTSTRGEYVITKVGSIGIITFNQHVGNAPSRQFVVISKLFGRTKLGFIDR